MTKIIVRATSVQKLAKTIFLTATLMGSVSNHAIADIIINPGINFGASYEAGYQAPPIGSDAGGSAKQRFTLNLAVDTDELFGVENGEFFAQYQNHNGEHGGGNIFDIQQFDGLDDPEYNRLHMLWYQHKFADGKLRIKVGKVEPKSEFFAPENARNHLGFSTERSPTIIAQGPPSMSFNAFFTPTENFTLAFGVYDAMWNQGRDENNFKLHNIFESSDLAFFLEGRVKWTDGFNGLPGGVKLGGWRLDGDKTQYDGDVVSGTNGFYLVVDQTVSSNGIGVYAQYGRADKKISPLSNHFGLGLQWKGPIQSRENDTFGLGASSVKFSNDADSPFIEKYETAYEAFYKAPINKWFTVQSDLQFINNPGGMGADDVVVATFRATLSF